MIWPHAGSPSDLVASIKDCLSHYPDATKKSVVFDKYQDISAKGCKGMRRGNEVIIDYDPSFASHLPQRDAIMKSKSDKQTLASVLGTFDLGEMIVLETRADGTISHGEADITMVSVVLQAAKSGQRVIHVLSDTNVFALLLYWVSEANLQCNVQINAACADLGQKCLQLLGMHALRGCDKTSYP